MDINTNSMGGLHSAWRNRYSDVYKVVKKANKGPPKSKRFNTAIWGEIYPSFMRRKKAINAYHEEDIGTLTTAAAYIRQLINSTSNNVSNSPTPSGGDENESTQVDNDVYFDVNEDNNTSTPILVGIFNIARYGSKSILR